MVFYVKCEKRDAQEKYGFSHQGIFAQEPIKKGQSIWRCQEETCDYLQLDDVKSGKTRAQTFEIWRLHPHLKDFIHKYMYMVDDDLYDWPKNYMEERLVEDCMFFNHSCDPTCGFGGIDSALVVAIRDIDVGEELTYDYQFMDTEPSFYDGINCRCGEKKCRGVLRFDKYRNVDWQKKYYKYCGNKYILDSKNYIDIIINLKFE